MSEFKTCPEQGEKLLDDGQTTTEILGMGLHYLMDCQEKGDLFYLVRPVLCNEKVPLFVSQQLYDLQ